MNRRLVSLAAFLFVVIVPGGIIGVATAPGDWYASLAKPFFNPPNWIFAPVWLSLYVLIAIAGWRVWTRLPASGAMAAWVVQLLLNWLWSPVFFSLHLLWPALAVIVAILVAIVFFIRLSGPIDRVAAWCFAPYLAWVSFAAALNGAVAVLN